jgi:hypothetical protein
VSINEQLAQAKAALEKIACEHIAFPETNFPYYAGMAVGTAREALAVLRAQPATDEPAVRVAIDSGPGGVTCIINPDEPAAGQEFEDPAVAKAWDRFTAKYAELTARKAERVHALVNEGSCPGMSEAFDAHMGAACWTDHAYRQDAATWAAAWRAALAAAPHPPARGAQAEAGGSRHPKRSPDEWREIAALEDAAGGCVAAGSLATPQQAAGQADLVQVAKEDANNYSLILTALGMEEEGDPVAEVKRLIALVDDLQEAAFKAEHEATPQPQRGAGEGLVPLSESRIEDCIDTANRKFNGRRQGPCGQPITIYDDWKYWLVREVEFAHGIRPAGSEGGAS